jgi:hypothetical protein
MGLDVARNREILVLKVKVWIERVQKTGAEIGRKLGGGQHKSNPVGPDPRRYGSEATQNKGQNITVYI